MTKMDYNTLRFAWTDLETTGTETKGGGILEIASIITDRHFNILESFETLVYPGEKVLSNINAFVTDMHTKNGLLKSVRSLGVPNQTEADEKFSEFLSRHNQGDRTNVLLAGNSVAAVDFPFLKEFAPKSKEQLHYRSLDVTSLRISAGIHFGDDTDFEKSGSHRALDDIRECIEEFRYVSAQVFKPKK